MERRTVCALALLLLAAPALADEIRLKDGTKITGTVIGFEDNSFKVQTSYGFALVRKDKIAAIIPSEAKPEPKKDAKPESKKPASQDAQVVPAVAAAAASVPQPPVTPSALMAKKEPTTPHAAPAAGAPIVAVPPAKPVPAPPEEPVIREEVQGNLYINHTYGFRMYKPPGWHVIEGTQKALPTAIVAMGTGDDMTLLVVGRERMKDSLEAHAAATERQLREIYENYRRLSERRTRVAGVAALERRYRGTVDGHDWSGVVLSLARGSDVFTILGTTYADSDLIQIQENVIAKAIASLEFTAR